MQTIHLVVELAQHPNDEIYVSVRALGDVRPEGLPVWNPNEPTSPTNFETGPNYSTARTVPGTLPEKLGQNVVDAIGMDIRRALEARLTQYLAGALPKTITNDH